MLIRNRRLNRAYSAFSMDEIMENTCIIPIVEGHGEVEAVRVLLSRIWLELLGGSYLHVLKPLRLSRGKIVKPEELSRYTELARRKLANEADYDNCCVLLLFDADDDLPCVLAGKVSGSISDHWDGTLFSCVIASKEFETWFVASADQMTDEFLDVDSAMAESAESDGRGKRWVERHSLGSYSETADMPRMAMGMDLALVRSRSPSFDKLCREMEKLKRRLAEETA